MYLSGHGPDKPEGGQVIGKVGTDITLEQAQEAAKLVAISLLSTLKVELGNLNKVKRIVKVFGMVNAIPSFEKHPQVINGCSDLLVAVFGESGRHAKNEVACSNCHSIHGELAADPTRVALKKRDPAVGPFETTSRQIEADTCGRCHQQIRSAILKPSHHPILEGKVRCTDCHNPHGSLSHAMVKQETVNDQCNSCHADKRGPYVFPHPPVEENCLSCHNPHGSSHRKLLNEAVPNLCQDCHDVARHPGTPYGGGAGWLCAPGDTTAACAGKTGAFNANVNTRLIARACNNCHNAIHGSNAPAGRGQFLFR